MSIPRVAAINAALAHHERKGTKPKCSVFHLLPNDLVMGIIKTELDRQKAEADTLEYWEQLIPPTTYDRFGAKGEEWLRLRGLKRNINHQIVQLASLNQSVKAVGYYTQKHPTEPVPSWCPTPTPKSVRVLQKDCSPAQKNATKKSDINYSCAIIRHFRARYFTPCSYTRSQAVIRDIGCKVASIWGGDKDAVRIAKISIRVNYDRHQ